MENKPTLIDQTPPPKELRALDLGKGDNLKMRIRYVLEEMTKRAQEGGPRRVIRRVPKQYFF